LRGGVARTAWRSCRAVLRLLPVQGRGRRRLKDYAYGRLPVLFKGTPGYDAWRAGPPRMAPAPAAVAPAGAAPGGVDPAALSAMLREKTAGEAPVASLIIPVYGQLDYTMRCLESIARAGATVAFEIL